MQEPSLQAGSSQSERSAARGAERASSGGVGAGEVGEDGLHGEGVLHGGDDAQAAATAGKGVGHLLIQEASGLPPAGLPAAPTVGTAPRGPGSGDRGLGQARFFGPLSQPQGARARNVKVTWTALPMGFKNDE